VQLNLRYDMNRPDFGASHPALYRAAIEQAAWADALGFTQVFLAEHHGAEGGYCPSSMVQAASILGATQRIATHLSALVVTMHDPLRLAEDLAVLDNIGPGRVWLTAVEDIRAAQAAGADALMVPKAQDPHKLATIREIAAETGLAAGLIALVETSQGVAALEALAAVPGVIGLALGTEDFSLAMGWSLSRRAGPSSRLLALAVPFRSRASAKRRIAQRPMAAAAYGVNGAICIHPGRWRRPMRCWRQRGSMRRGGRHSCRLERGAGAGPFGGIAGRADDRPARGRTRASQAG
jgi:hypothetical protein